MKATFLRTIFYSKMTQTAALTLILFLSTTIAQQYQYPQSQYNRGQYDPPDQYFGQYTPPGQYSPSVQYGSQSQFPQTQNQGHFAQSPQGGQFESQDPYNRKYDQQSNYGQPLFGRDDNCCDEYCYSEDETRYYYFGTVTAYSFIYGKRLRDHVVPRK